MGRVFGFDPKPESAERFAALLELDRTRCAFDEGQMVGTCGAFSLEMAVPGGTVACGGTTMVSVLPSHRRQGVLAEMMTAHLDDVTARGEPIAALWASESSIYGRFGYGGAAEVLEIEIPRTHVGLHRLAPPRHPVRIIDKEQAKVLLPGIYERIWRSYPGAYRRGEGWWTHRWFEAPPSPEEGTSMRYALSVGPGGEPSGFVQYRQQSKWEKQHGAGRIKVAELVGTDPESWSGLWAFVLNQDLVATITADRPPHDPLFDLLGAPRRVVARISDSLWVRLMDVPAALERRRYLGPGVVVLEVHDPLGRAGGRYRLEVSESGEALCAPTQAAAEIALDLEDLGACYLGRSRLRELARAGRLSGDHTALTRADTLFSWQPQPWCPEVF
jgi:predicted acetyltransferase